jgi:hypothetical protein
MPSNTHIKGRIHALDRARERSNAQCAICAMSQWGSGAIRIIRSRSRSPLIDSDKKNIRNGPCLIIDKKMYLNAVTGFAQHMPLALLLLLLTSTPTPLSGWSARGSTGHWICSWFKCQSHLQGPFCGETPESVRDVSFDLIRTTTPQGMDITRNEPIACRPRCLRLVGVAVGAVCVCAEKNANRGSRTYRGRFFTK